MVHEGVDVLRMNLSHDTHQEHLKTIRYVTEINEELGSSVAILGDLQGPKLRLGDMENDSVQLEDGQSFSFVSEPCMGTTEKAFLSYERLPADVVQGERILVDDGKLVFEVTGSNGRDTVTTRVITGGPLSSKKGVNLPHTRISQPSLTEKDIADAHFLLDNKVDWIALSFVRKAKDILDLRKIIEAHPNTARIVAKIEKPEALEEIDEIIEAADAVMVARGDLGVEVDFHKVPLIQKDVIRLTNLKGKLDICATQMLGSMTQSTRPTRAEASDIANAVLDGVDALMLSDETAVGKHPIEAVRMMDSIIGEVEKRSTRSSRISR